MKRLIILLSFLAGLALLPYGNTAASSPFAPQSTVDAKVPAASNVITISGAVSGLGMVGHYILGRRQR